MSTTMTVSFPCDGDGFASFECPFCGSTFKLSADEYQSDDEPVDELFCPYCGLVKERQAFLNSQAVEYLNSLVENYAIDLLNEAFGKTAKSINRSKGPISMKFTPIKKEERKKPIEQDSAETTFVCNCCSRSVRVLQCFGESKIFCPYCGVDL